MINHRQICPLTDKQKSINFSILVTDPVISTAEKSQGSPDPEERWKDAKTQASLSEETTRKRSS